MGMESKAPPLFCPDGRDHCFHGQKEQHKVSTPGALHADVVCCWCGTESCRTIWIEKRPGHGPFTPSGGVPDIMAVLWKASRVYSRLEEPERKKSPLLPDQAEMLMLFSQGIKFPQLMKHYGLNRPVLTARFTRIKDKLKAKSSIHAVAIAIREGYIS